MNKQNKYNINLGGLELGDSSLFAEDLFDIPEKKIESIIDVPNKKPVLAERKREATRTEIIDKFVSINSNGTSNIADFGLLHTDDDFDDSFDIIEDTKETTQETEEISKDSIESVAERGQIVVEQPLEIMQTDDSFDDSFIDEQEEKNVEKEINRNTDEDSDEEQEYAIYDTDITYDIELEDEENETDIDGIDIEDEIDNLEIDEEELGIDDIDIEEEIDNLEIEEEVEEEVGEELGEELEEEVNTVSHIDKSDDEVHFSLDDLDDIDVENMEFEEEDSKIFEKSVENSVKNVDNFEHIVCNDDTERDIDLDDINFDDLNDENDTEVINAVFEDIDIETEETSDEAVQNEIKSAEIKKDNTDETGCKESNISTNSELQGIREDIADLKRVIQSRGVAQARNRASEVRKGNKIDEFTKNSKSLNSRNSIEIYNTMTIDALYSEVKKFMIQNGVSKHPIELDILNKTFGDRNIVRLVKTSYLIILGKGVTIGR